MGLDLARVSPMGERQFALFRVLFGLFLAIHFLGLVGYGGELFGAAGLLADPRLNFTWGILPNPLEHWGSPAFVRAFLLALVALSLAFAAGFQRRVVAFLLWYGWACLFNRNNLISNPSLPFVGLLLLMCVVVPSGEAFSWDRRRRRSEESTWFMPGYVVAGVWILLALGYTYSGLDKLIHSPSWRDGSALTHVLHLPLARPGLGRDLFLALPPGAIRLATWGALALEIASLPLCASRRTRWLAWGALVSMHVGILVLVDFADLTWGMLLVHLFVFDPTWGRAVQDALASRSAATEAQPA